MGAIKHFNAGAILASMEGTVVLCDTDGMETEYTSKEEIIEKLERDHKNITSMKARENKIVLTLQKDEVVLNYSNAQWMKDYVRENGVEPSFF